MVNSTPASGSLYLHSHILLDSIHKKCWACNKYNMTIIIHRNSLFEYEIFLRCVSCKAHERSMYIGSPENVLDIVRGAVNLDYNILELISERDISKIRR